MDKWKVKVVEYNRILAEGLVTPSDIERGCKISYDAACRIVRNGITNRTENSEKVGKYLIKIDNKFKNAKTTNKKTDTIKVKLSLLLDRVWDGTEEHAELIQRLLKIAGRCKPSSRQ